jgi:light-regulated signal transduction histidine kinase (bacteriophytochrome)
LYGRINQHRAYIITASILITVLWAIGVSANEEASSTSAFSNRDYIIALLTSILIITSIFLLARESKNSKALKQARDKAEEELQSRKETERQLLVREQELLRSNEELEKFAYIASHDLQEPLRKVQTFANLLQEECSESISPLGIDYLSHMKDSAERMRILINDVLTFSRINNTSNKHKMVNLNEVVSGVLNDFELLIKESQATIECQDLPQIKADGVQMRQIFQNLIGNALKYRHVERPPVIPINNQIKAADNDLCVIFELTVSDNGIGFDQKYSQRIFEIFQRLHGRSEYSGTGIGLALVKRIAECHSGSATATSSPGEGATFTISLQLKKTSANTEDTILNYNNN